MKDLESIHKYTCRTNNAIARFHITQQQETLLSLTNRATRLEILTFQKYRDLEIGVRVTKGHWKCHHSIQRTRLPTDVQ